MGTYAWTPMLATATGNRDKDPTLNRFPEMDVYGTVLALKNVEKQRQGPYTKSFPRNGRVWNSACTQKCGKTGKIKKHEKHKKQ